MVRRRAGVQGVTLPVEIRRADAGDLDAVAAVWHESAARMDAAAVPMPSRQDLRERIDRELSNGWEIHVAERNGRAVGMLAVTPNTATLDQIFVLPKAERSGVGTALMEVAKGAMPGGFTLRMASANRRAASFYAAAGLQPAGDGIHPVSGVAVTFFRWPASS